MRRVCLLVLDSLGVGGALDAAQFNDLGADTLGHIATACAQGLADVGRKGPLRLPTLSDLGLGLAAELSTGELPPGLEVPGRILGRYGCASEISRGKDTPSGHFEMTGAPVFLDWGYFTPDTSSIPKDLLDELSARAGLPGVLGNCKASGIEILTRLGEEHLRSGRPIVYTSVDSVLQIAAHEEAFGLERLYEVCAIARELADKYRIARVIARPFMGRDRGSFVRTGNRRDYSIPAPSPTILDLLTAAGGTVLCVGKVGDIFAHRGVGRSIRAHGHDRLMDATLAAWDGAGDRTLVMTNFVDFDSVHGHRRDVAGYARALESLDARLPELLSRLMPGDLCILTADHGCDPTWPGTDHTRERVPVLAVGPGIAPGCMGVRDSLSDIGASVAHFFGIDGTGHGRSFFAQDELSNIS
ncbi:phosphopentomutase [Desulfomicrobium macestii]|uniref:Phosphopentomutase n=2 Tax=Desulfomicrobium TaxID=898 RepID=A0A8G2BZE6_DESNO|nr:MULTISPECIES: phosphopentomutase [Desulfomicrobium]MBE1423517.1 phosphopentomutase [Desulfomicrobium macestii]SFL24300.1 phosphopentomutase [Desulfomicrobium norvegicum]